MATLDPDPTAGKFREDSVFREEMIRRQFECRRCKMEPLRILRGIRTTWGAVQQRILQGTH